MTASVASFLAQAQKKGAELPPPLSGALLLAAVRLSEAQRQAVRPYQLLVDDDGALELLSGDVPTNDGYAAPELRNGAVLQDDPRVLVFAVGALAYELVTLTPPRLGEEGAGPEIKGALAPVIRKALAERQHRFRTLRELSRAIEGIQGRPTPQEERLILAAVAASTPLPASQKLAKLELQKAAAPDTSPPQPEPPEKPPPVFTQIWDPLEAAQPAASKEAKPAEPPPPPPAPPAVSEEDRQERLAIRAAFEKGMAAIEKGKRDVADLGTRISMVEEQIRSSLPPLTGTALLARDVRQMIDRRSFAEAERALQDPLVANDAILQLLLGQALSGGSGADEPRLDRAAAAFRRAAELDASWAEPHVLLGAMLWRQGKQGEARACFAEALQRDPASPQALAALGTSTPPARVQPAWFAISGAAGALAAAVLLLAFRPSSPPRQEEQTAAVRTTSVAAVPPPSAAALPVATVPPLASAEAEPPKPPEPPAVKPQPPPAPKPAQQEKPAAQPVALRLPERTPEPEPEPERRPAPRTESKREPKKITRSSGSRTAAEAEAARGDKALRAFDTKSAQAAFGAALKLDPTLPSAHRGMGMVYVLLGKNAEAKAEYTRYLQLAPDAPDRDQIARVLAR